MTPTQGDHADRPRVAVVVGDGARQRLRPIEDRDGPVDTIASGPAAPKVEAAVR